MAFRVMEVGLPGKPACPDEFQDEGQTVLLCPDSKVITVQIGKNAAYLQFGVMPQGRSLSPGAVVWQKARSWTPTSFSLGRNFDAVRVRNFTAGQEAQITLEAY
jgi:hypothetical protein